MSSTIGVQSNHMKQTGTSETYHDAPEDDEVLKKLKCRRKRGEESEIQRVAAAQERTKALRTKAKEESRSLKFVQIQIENDKLARRLEWALGRNFSGDSRRRNLLKPVEMLKQHERILNVRREGRLRQRQEKLDRINLDNSKLLNRIRSQKTDYGYYSQAKLKKAREKEVIKYRELSRKIKLQSADQISHCPPKVEIPCEKKEEKIIHKVSVRRNNVMNELAHQRQKSGMYQHSVAEFRVHQKAITLDNDHYIVSFYEKSEESKSLRISLYNTKSCSSQDIFVTRSEIIGALGPDAEISVLGKDTRVTLCELLVTQLRSFKIDGRKTVILASYLSFQGREGCLMAEKRALQHHLGKVSLGKLKTIPKFDGTEICSSIQVQSVVEKASKSAFQSGLPYPVFESISKPTGVVENIERGFRQRGRTERKLLIQENLQEEGVSTEIPQEDFLYHSLQQSESLEIILEDLNLSARIKVIGNHVSVFLRDYGGIDQNWQECTAYLRPSLRFHLGIQVLSKSESEKELSESLSQELNRMLG